MSGSSWRADLDAVDADLVDGYQSGFPVESRPFRAVGDSLGVSERDALDRVRRLSDRGIFRRFGPVLNPPVIGSSMLAAARAPPERFDEVAAVVNDHPQVNHNYERDHGWNMWFVVTAGSLARRDAIVDDIGRRTGLDVLRLPMRTDYYIDLEFPVVNTDRFARESLGDGESGAARDGSGTGGESASGVAASGKSASNTRRVEPTRIPEAAAGDLSGIEASVLLAVQEGLPLTETPYADVAATIDAGVDDVVAAIHGLLDRNCVKRVGCVVNHVVTGFDSNCMVVWDVPDDRRDDRGAVVGGLPYVTLCYHRPRRPDQGWEYNLFTMVHGRERAAVDEKIDELAAEHLPFDHERLYSTATLKQTGARYEDLLAVDPAPADD